MQNHYNLLYREEEREMLPLCAAEGIGVIPWSPLARGRLARPMAGEDQQRAETDEFGKTLYAETEDADREVVERVGEVAERAGRAAGAGRAGLAARRSPASRRRSSARRSRSTWRTRSQRCRSKLTAEEIAALEEPYVPHPVLGFS